MKKLFKFPNGDKYEGDIKSEIKVIKKENFAR